MTRVTCAPARHKRHKKILKMAKGYRGRAKNCYKTAKQSVERALRFAYIDRRRKKRDFRRLWITRINAAVRLRGMKYSEFMSALKKNDVFLDRKALSEMAIKSPEIFDKVVENVKDSALTHKASIA